MVKRLYSFAVLLGALSYGNIATADSELHVYNWSDYIGETTVADFEKETGIKVVYDVYDSNEILEAKLLAGRSGYDVVFPTARPFADRQLKAGILQPLQKDLLSNYGNIDPVILASLADLDPQNNHMVPYMWGTTGIGYNVDKVKSLLGEDAPVNTWALIFNPEIAGKLASCGISLMDDATEVFAAAKIYLGIDASDFSKATQEAVAALVAKTRKNIRYFHSSQYINDLANGDLCVAHGYSGDVLQARARAEEAEKGVNVAYTVPQEGAVVWSDVMVIPKDAPNPKAAHAFINYLMQPEVIASASNAVAYANANAKATPFVDEAIRNDPGVYPAEATRQRLVVLIAPSNNETRAITRLWTRIKTGK
ncbi:polyamine ABC transporter substrate-binding protein [Saccharophagus degradans]|uniref:polyamine ABC transporter substrate-binding protein n=1 Tax=Saccharophagus degradans TaxID=86304 RepID=UPI0024782178|nr:polyamine ABC transporter substrate-binding protein [Saccharophagus degradans]WGO97188.1 polyamine ABC transporter substrate-binding protein [Saccharophagus degradans]